MGISRDCPFFWVPPIISGTGKATDFKFGEYIYRASPNKIPLKILPKILMLLQLATLSSGGLNKKCWENKKAKKTRFIEKLEVWGRARRCLGQYLTRVKI